MVLINNCVLTLLMPSPLTVQLLEVRTNTGDTAWCILQPLWSVMSLLTVLKPPTTCNLDSALSTSNLCKYIFHICWSMSCTQNSFKSQPWGWIFYSGFCCKNVSDDIDPFGSSRDIASSMLLQLFCHHSLWAILTASELRRYGKNDHI